jgi:hypothetical protein
MSPTLPPLGISILRDGRISYREQAEPDEAFDTEDYRAFLDNQKAVFKRR